MELLEKLGKYILSDSPEWIQARDLACRENNWFTPEFIDLAITSITPHYLAPEVLQQVAHHYNIPEQHPHSRTVGIVMAGNIPLVGFHDFCCTFLAGHRMRIKASSKDRILIKHLVQKLTEWNPVVESLVTFAEMLKGCDAYIATGSNQSSAYFTHYFGKYPHLIRRNRTGIAILSGRETTALLELLADDVHQYFGLGCRNVTKLYVPEGYDFLPLLEAFKKYSHLAVHHKFKNNYDYQLALLIINKKYYMTNGVLLLVEAPSLFAPIGQIHYEYYSDPKALTASLAQNPDVQCIVGEGHTPFGQAQQPGFMDYADGVDTLKFLLEH